MPRQKRIPEGAIRTSANIPDKLHLAIYQELPLVSRKFTLAEAINEGLILWMAYRTGDKFTKQQLEDVLNSWREKFEEAKADAKKTPAKIARSGTKG